MKDARAYVASLRNPLKRDYAARYLAYLAGPIAKSPEWSGISYMAAQAVRIRLDAYYMAHLERCV